MKSFDEREQLACVTKHLMLRQANSAMTADSESANAFADMYISIRRANVLTHSEDARKEYLKKQAKNFAVFAPAVASVGLTPAGATVATLFARYNRKSHYESDQRLEYPRAIDDITSMIREEATPANIKDRLKGALKDFFDEGLLTIGDAAGMFPGGPY